MASSSGVEVLRVGKERLWRRGIAIVRPRGWNRRNGKRGYPYAAVPQRKANLNNAAV